MNSGIIKIEIPLYYSLVFVCLKKEDFDIKYIKKHTNKFYGKDVFDNEDFYKLLKDYNETVALGRVFDKGGLQVLYVKDFNKTIDDYATLQHEIAHVAFCILGYRGLTLCIESAEAYTYLIGYLTKEIYKHII